MSPENTLNSQNSEATPPQTPPPLPHTRIGSIALLEPGEHLVNSVKRHPIGLVAIYLESFASLAAILALALVLIPSFSEHISRQDYGLLSALGVIVLGFLLALLLITTKIYRGCQLLITDKNLVQILRRSLFNKKISRLSMSNVEDVNVEQRGILPSIFNYGTLTIQTAGEIDNFIFPLCPRPNDYAHQILEARQSFVNKSS